MKSLTGKDALFKLTSNILPWQAIPIEYTPVNTNGNFLDNTGGLTDTGVKRTSGVITFTAAQSGNNFEAKLPVPTFHDANVNSGLITVTLQPDSTNTPVYYTLSDTDSERKATVTIEHAPIPQLSIADATATIKEGETARFVVTATVEPKRTIPIKIIPTNNPNGDFLDTTLGAAGTTRIVRQKFTDPSGTQNWTSTIEIPTRAPDGIDANHGSITVTLANPITSDGYTIAAAPDNDGIVTVQDFETPLIVIDNAPLTLAGSKASFKLTSDIQPLESLTIYYLPTNLTTNNVSTNFLDTTGITIGDDWMTTVPFESAGAGQPYIGTLPVPTVDDPNATDGTINVLLLDDLATNNPKHYKVSPISTLRTATGSVIDIPNITLSIAAKNTSIQEGEEAKFVITSSENPRGALKVKYTPTDPIGFIDTSTVTSGTAIEKTLTFSQLHTSAPWTAEISIPMRNADGNDSNHSDLVVTLNTNDAGYAIANAPNHSATTKVYNTDIPVIEISNASAVEYGNDAEFILQASIRPWQNLTVRFTPENETGNFLDANTYTSETTYEKAVPFAATGDITGTLPIPTVDDPDNDSGTIKVTLVADDTTPPDYTITTVVANQSATGSVTGAPDPTLSIAASPTRSVEGDKAYFQLTATLEPADKDIEVKFTVSQSFPQNVTPFLETTVDTTNPIKDTVTFSNPGGSDDWIATLALDLRNTDNTDTDHGTVTVTLSTPEADANYLVASSPNNTEQITIYDKEIPGNYDC